MWYFAEAAIRELKQQIGDVTYQLQQQESRGQTTRATGNTFSTRKKNGESSFFCGIIRKRISHIFGREKSRKSK